MTFRKPLRRRQDPVTPEMAATIFLRDGGCVAPRIGGSAADCWGRMTIEHVKRELRAAKRAEPVPECLVTLCEGHTEPGRRAGYQWNTDKRNRALVRDYLANQHTHVDPVYGCRDCPVSVPPL